MAAIKNKLLMKNSNNNRSLPEPETEEDTIYSSGDDVVIEEPIVTCDKHRSNTTSTTAASLGNTHTVTGIASASISGNKQASKPPVNVEAVAEPQQESIQLIDITLLKPSPVNIDIYGDEPVDTELAASIKANGFQEPLIASTDKTLIAGHRRLKAAKALNMTHVPVLTREYSSEIKKQIALLESNRQRQKNNVAIGNEAILRKKIESEMAKARQRRAGSKEGEQQAIKVDKTAKEKGSARDNTGAQLGMSGVTVDRLISSVTALRKLQKDGSIEAAESLYDKINASINAGYNEGIRLGVITKPESKKKAEPKPPSNSKTEGAASKNEAQPEKKTEPSAYPTTGDLPQIENHAMAMRHLDLIIEYAEDLGGDDITEGHRTEWQESMQSLTDALRKMGIIED
jgi:ParB/RepB/Spo0J family partition protein